MLSVDAALRIILGAAAPLEAESIPVADAYSRVLAADVIARTSQPPFNASAMDGYAVRLEDAVVGASLAVIGESRAGVAFTKRIGPHEAVRIFTGGAVPEGADHVVIQEDVAAGEGRIVIEKAQRQAENIRFAGIDFREGDVVFSRGRRISAIDAAMIAAANLETVAVRRKARVAYFDNGDELREPGSALGPGEIVGSTRFAFDRLIAEWGAEPLYLGRARDDRAEIARLFDRAEADVVVPIGGASVGDYDLVKAAFADCGGGFAFEKISVKPGKPTWFGRLGSARVLGLPGNPASALVCAHLFLRPLIAALYGQSVDGATRRISLAAALPANGARESYLRAHFEGGGVAAFENQDSSLLLPFARADCLIRRAAHAQEAPDGEIVDCVLL